MQDPTEYVYIAFPRELYEEIILRSRGKLDPGHVAIYEVEGFMAQTRYDPSFWDEQVIEEELVDEFLDEYGASSFGYRWQNVFLPNGTKVRMTYQGSTSVAEIKHEKLTFEGEALSPSEFASQVANNTNRNAWRDLWVRRPKDTDWIAADVLRRGSRP